MDLSDFRVVVTKTGKKEAEVWQEKQQQLRLQVMSATLQQMQHKLSKDTNLIENFPVQGTSKRTGGAHMS